METNRSKLITSSVECLVNTDLNPRKHNKYQIIRQMLRRDLKQFAVVNLGKFFLDNTV